MWQAAIDRFPAVPGSDERLSSDCSSFSTPAPGGRVVGGRSPGALNSQASV